MAQAKTLSSARIKVLINNQTVGFVTGFSWSVQYGKKTIRGIDNPFPQEIAPGQQMVRGTVQCIRLIGSPGIEDYGIVANQGVTGEESGIASDQQIEKYISIALIDRGTDKIIFKVDKAMVMSQNWTVAVRGMVEGSFEFEAFTTSVLS